MNEINRLIILGNGGQADEAQSYSSGERFVVRAVSKEYLHPGDSSLIDVEDPGEDYASSPTIAAIGAPAVRKSLVETWQGNEYETIISEHAIVDPSAKIGEGSIIAPRAVLTTNIEVGRHCIVNVACTISHDVKIGDFVTIGPGANIAGKVRVGEGAFIGIGAVISNDVTLAPGVVLGAGAVLVEDATEENGVYAGVPAKLIKRNDGWLREV